MRMATRAGSIANAARDLPEILRCVDINGSWFKRHIAHGEALIRQQVSATCIVPKRQKVAETAAREQDGRTCRARKCRRDNLIVGAAPRCLQCLQVRGRDQSLVSKHYDDRPGNVLHRANCLRNRCAKPIGIVIVAQKKPRQRITGSNDSFPVVADDQYRVSAAGQDGEFQRSLYEWCAVDFGQLLAGPKARGRTCRHDCGEH